MQQNSLLRSTAEPIRSPRTVFQAWMTFVHAERWEQRLGDLGTRSRAALWRQSPSEKEEDAACITGLAVDSEHSDFDTMRLVLHKDAIGSCSLRVGDLVTLHTGRQSTLTMQILKGSLEAIDDRHLTVVLRNKQVSRSHLMDHAWTVESDVADALLTHVVPSLRSLLSADERRLSTLLGRRQPEFLRSTPSHDDDLSDEQREIVGRALSAQDYFLIQGPPGTGKTSRLLRSIVQALLQDPTERILVLAYTNRAVNEICQVLDASLPPGSYLRHGSAAGVRGADQDAAIPALGRQLSPDELALRLSTTRCIVATVSSLHSGRDIFAFGAFTTTVVDEASQILEPYLIGPLLQSQRTIMIGDHYQLPPVIALPSESLSIRAQHLTDIGFTNLGMTTFERLHRRCSDAGWQQAVSTLTRQGRMHRDVMEFPSKTFYDGKLTTIDSWQEDPSPLPWNDVLPHRAMFVPVDADQQATEEARIITDLVVEVDRAAKLFGKEVTIGVITPFRVQNRAISLLLPQSLRENVTVDTVERFQGSQRDVIFFWCQCW